MAPQAFVPINRRPKSELGSAASPQPSGAAKPTATQIAAPKAKVAKAAKAKRSTSAFPVLPALAATLLVLGGVQAGMWWWGQSAKTSTPARTSQATSAPLASLPRPASQMNVPALPQNLQFGDAQGRVTVTIFSDPSCGACRMRVRELIGGLPSDGVRYVYKFWPNNPSLATPGLLMELARREGAIAKFWTALQGSGEGDLSDTDLLHMLDRAGVPLAAQRKALAEHSGILTDALEPDLRVAATANLPAPPVVLVNNMVMDTASLTPSGLNRYVGQLLAGREIPAPVAEIDPDDLRALLPH